MLYDLLASRQWGWSESSLVSVFMHLPQDLLHAIKLVSYSLMVTHSPPSPQPTPPSLPPARVACATKCVTEPHVRHGAARRRISLGHGPVQCVCVRARAPCRAVCALADAWPWIRGVAARLAVSGRREGLRGTGSSRRGPLRARSGEARTGSRGPHRASPELRTGRHRLGMSASAAASVKSALILFRIRTGSVKS